MTNSKTSPPIHTILKFLKTEDKDKILKSAKHPKKLNGRVLLIGNQGCQRNGIASFQSSERKELLMQASIPSKNILQKSRHSQMKGSCHPTDLP
jgi:hypothetical protein